MDREKKQKEELVHEIDGKGTVKIQPFEQNGSVMNRLKTVQSVKNHRLNTLKKKNLFKCTHLCTFVYTSIKSISCVR